MIIISWMKDNKIFYLIGGFIFSIFSIGRYNIPIFIYIWPFCFLSYLHQKETKLIPIIIVIACLILSNMIRWIGMTNDTIFLDFSMGLYYSIINIIPFVIDKLLYNHISKWASIFLFPLLVSCLEFIFSFCPLANYNCYAYALRDNIQIIQISSLFGCYFLSFILALFPSILDYSLELYKKDNILISKFLYLYALLYLIIYIFGSIRLLLPEEKGKYNIAGALGISQYLDSINQKAELPISDYMEYINDTIIRAKNSESKIIIYGEEAFAIFKNDREEIVNKTAELAKENNIYVVLTLDIEYKEDYLTNEAVLISDKGDILYNYQKQHLIPVLEGSYYEEMKETKVIKTDLGNLGLVICYDIVFPYYINSLSRDDIDILLVPSWDWEGITEFHSVNVRFRSIENGFNVIKITANGIVLSTDYKGRFLSYYNGNDYDDFFVISQVNKKGIKTLYSYIGIFFNYLYILAIIVIIIIGRCQIVKEEKSNNRIDSDFDALSGLKDMAIEY